MQPDPLPPIGWLKTQRPHFSSRNSTLTPIALVGEGGWLYEKLHAVHALIGTPPIAGFGATAQQSVGPVVGWWASKTPPTLLAEINYSIVAGSWLTDFGPVGGLQNRPTVAAFPRMRVLCESARRSRPIFSQRLMALNLRTQAVIAVSVGSRSMLEAPKKPTTPLV